MTSNPGLAANEPAIDPNAAETTERTVEHRSGGPLAIPKSIVGAALAIGGLIVLAVLVVLVSLGRQSNFPPDSPEGTVQSYLRALESDDVEAAYAYFSSTVQSDMTLTEYRRVVRDQYYEEDARRITVDRVEITGDRARLFLNVGYGGGGLFGGSGYTDTREIPLIREAAAWRIDEPLAGIDRTFIERF